MSDNGAILSSVDIGQRILLVLLLILINAFFVTIEFAIFAVRRSRIAELVASGDDLAKTVQDLQRGIERLLSTTQLGITLSSLALGWIGERALAQILFQSLRDLPIPFNLNEPIAHSLAIIFTFTFLAYLQIVFGELIPKSIAIIYAEQIARFLGTPSLAIARFFSPIIWILDRSTRLFLRSIGIEQQDRAHSRMTFKELQTTIGMESESLGLLAGQRELLNKIFEFTEVVAADIMTQRTQMQTISHTATFQDLLNLVNQTGFSRFPVISTSLDCITGVLSFKDFAPCLSAGKLSATTPIQAWIKPVQYVAESTLVSDILMMMQEADTKMTIVVDEFGNTAGLITRQDAIAKMIGIKSDRQAAPIQKLSADRFLVQAQINIAELNDRLGLDIPVDDDYQTLGGFLLYKLQQLPHVGESLRYNDWELTVASTVGLRIHQVQIQRVS
jgi:CBS domain containing-hemolysin-like protein